jgi:hypothetical protein
MWRAGRLLAKVRRAVGLHQQAMEGVQMLCQRIYFTTIFGGKKQLAAMKRCTSAAKGAEQRYTDQLAIIYQTAASCPPPASHLPLFFYFTN